jgi:multiple sugar transport system substrate-binding protein
MKIALRVQIVTWPARRAVTWEDPMNNMTRRDALKAGGATVAVALLPSDVAQAAPTWNGPAPEPGAQIRVLRWKQFIQSEFDSFIVNTKKFVEHTGVKVRVDAEIWDDIRPKAALAASVGAGPDIIMGTLDDPFKFPDKLLDMTDLAEYLGRSTAAGILSQGNTGCSATGGLRCRRAAR